MSLQKLREKNVMPIHELSDPAFAVYGRVVEGMDFSPVVAWLQKDAPMPETGVVYFPGVDALEALETKARMQAELFGGLEMQLGVCCGYNQDLNAFEYHRTSEFNVSGTDAVLLLGKQQDVVDGTYDTAKIEAFYMPAGVCAELYATTLHYAPVSPDERGFRMAVALHKDTNTELNAPLGSARENRLLFAVNKWLMAHPGDASLRGKAHAGLTGENLHINL